jgi:tetratricopeptide (TPR) repeat protein/outer membrane protein OmpA-like peptidoglycan-associated protein
VPWLEEFYTNMKSVPFTLATLFLFNTCLMWGQKIDKANIYYRHGLYAAAIPIYEALIKKKNDPVAKSHLADCYRILNKADKAASLYAQIIADSTAKEKDYFNYGDVMMMLGKYDSAKYFFKKFIDLKPNDPQGEQSLQACENAYKIKPFYTNISINPFSENSDADENAPVFFKNKLLFASDRSTGYKAFKETNQTTGREYIRVWSAQKINDSTYTQAVSFSSKLNNLNDNTGSVSFTADSKEVYFCRNSDFPDKNNTYNMQIYSAESKDGEKWSNVEKLPFCSNQLNYFYPSVSPDGKYLFFVSDKGGGYGGLDIYVSKRTKKGWSKPENLGGNVNTPAHEGFPYTVEDGNLYFCSRGHVGYGGFDIFVTRQDSATGEWIKPINLGTPINSAYDDISITFADSTHGAFASPRSGRSDDIFFFTLNQNSVKKQEETNGNKYLTFYTNEKPTEDEDLKFVQDFSFASNTAYLDTLASSLSRKKNLRKGKIFTLDGIAFNPKTGAFMPTVKEELDKLADIMGLYRNIAFEIGVHSGGSDLMDIKAQDRANNVLQYLIEKGINPKRLSAKGYNNTEKNGVELKIKELN